MDHSSATFALYFIIPFSGAAPSACGITRMGWDAVNRAVRGPCSIEGYRYPRGNILRIVQGKVGRGERKIRLSGRETANMVVTLFDR